MRLPNSVVYRQRAETAARLAAESSLANVRANFLKVEQSWRAMAAQAVKLEGMDARRRFRVVRDA